MSRALTVAEGGFILTLVAGAVHGLGAHVEEEPQIPEAHRIGLSQSEPALEFSDQEFLEVQPCWAFRHRA